MSSELSHTHSPDSLRPRALGGLWCAVFGLLALSSPGRIDIVDGGTRYAVAQSIVDHGDTAIRDDRVWFAVFPGRPDANGEPTRRSTYRFPHIALGVGAILCADASGPRTEGRRHFFFTLLGPCAGATIAVGYAIWFRRRGLSPRQALLFAILGIFVTPLWYFSTTTFDDIFAAAVLIGTILLADHRRMHKGSLWGLPIGLLLGLLFNCKEPLGAFGLAVVAAYDDPAQARRIRFVRAALIGFGLLFGIIAYRAYDRYNFPPGSAGVEAKKAYGVADENTWSPDPVGCFVNLAISPGAGIVWYSPTVLLLLIGAWRQQRGHDRRLALAALLSAGIVVAFICRLFYFKGDICWGPRYTTPLIGLLWFYAPAGAEFLGRSTTRILIAAGLLVQILGISMDPNRLYVEHGLPGLFYRTDPYVYCKWEYAHLIQRPREIVEGAVWLETSSDCWTPVDTPTWMFPGLESIYFHFGHGKQAVRRIHILKGFRPWPNSYLYLPAEDRPIDYGAFLSAFLAFVVVGCRLLRNPIADRHGADHNSCCCQLVIHPNSRG